MKSFSLPGRFNNFSYLICVMILVLFLGQPAFGGKLEDFEQDVTEEREENKSRYYEDEDEEDEGFWGSLFRGIFEGIFDDDDDEYIDSGGSKIEFRQSPNKALLPTFRIDGGFQDVESDVQAFDSWLELGFGHYGIQGRFTGYREDEPSDELEFGQIHGLFRLPLGDVVETDFGAGVVFLNGENRNSGFSLTLPILFYPKESVGLEFRPCWSWINENPIRDYDLGLVLSRYHVSLRLGYRWFRSEHESLDGPYVGLSFRF